MLCLLKISTYNIAFASAFYPSRPQKKSAKTSAFYTFENPQVCRSPGPHFTGGLVVLYTKQWAIKLSKMLVKSTHRPCRLPQRTRINHRTAQTSNAV